MDLKDILGSINPHKKLNYQEKKHMIEIFRQQKNEKNTVIDTAIEEEKRQLMDKYRKKVNYESKLARIKKAEHELEQANEELARVGLDTDGSRANIGYNETNAQKERAVEHIDNMLEAVDKAHKITNNYDSKIELLLWGADNIGTVYNILNQVLGNSILPHFDKKQLEHKE